MHPDKWAFTFLSDGETPEVHLTYGELDRKARAIGARLQACVGGDARALLVYPSAPEFIVAFLGCQYAGIIAVPTYPPQTRTKRSLEKLRTIVKDVQPSVVLTVSSLTSAVENLFALAQEELSTTPLLTTDSIEDDAAGKWQEPAITGDTLAFIQYTSGSTGLPKGVMLTHSNLLYNMSMIYEYFGVTPETSGVNWLPPYHDMGLIGMILETIYSGAHDIIMSPVAFLQRPIRWLQAVSDTGATMSGGPNFAYELCCRKITPEQKEKLDLRRWKLAFNGAEPIRLETLERFAETFASCGFRKEAFYPCYGLAEASLMATGGERDRFPVVRTLQAEALAHNRVVEATSGEKDVRTFVSCGKTVRGQKIVIANPETLRACQPDEVGEVWISGPSVAQGYWQRPQETKETFQAYLADTGEGPFLRTGDLGFLQDGELFITGRLKDLIIIRGRNYYPQDIELTVEQSHPALRPGCGVAFSIEAQGEERLVIVQEVERRYWNVDVHEVAESIRRAVAEEHELQVYAVALIKTGSIPKTSSGKLQRRACREKYLARDLEIVGEWTLPLEESWQEASFQDQDGLPATAAIEDRSRSIREELLQTAPPERQRLLENYMRDKIAASLKLSLAGLDVERPLNSLGLDSLTAMELKGWIEAELAVEVPIAIFLEEPSISQFAARLLEQLEPAGSSQSNTAQVDRAGQDGHVDGQHVMSNGLANEIGSHEAEQLLMRLDQLSDAEIDALLGQIAEDEQAEASKETDDTPGFSAQEAEQLLAELDRLSDDEVDVLLSQLVEKESLE